MSTEAVFADEASPSSQEEQIKAAFIFNFIKFIDWPAEDTNDSNEPIIVGIIGNENTVKAFDPVKARQIKNRNISIKYIDGFGKTKESKEKNDSQWNQKIESLKKCHVLMFCTHDSTEIENPGRIIEALKGSSVLTVGEKAGFLELGGMINFVVEDEKVRFEVNLKESDNAKLKISSNLLRLAKKVIKKPTKSADDKSK